MTATLSTATGRTHRVLLVREVLDNYFVADGDRDRGAYGAEARTACHRTYEGLVMPGGSGVTCAKCEAAEEAAPVAKAVPAAATRDEVTVAVTAPRYVAVRELGRYRVIDADAAPSDPARFVAVAASRAKAEEKAAKLNAEQEPELDRDAEYERGLITAEEYEALTGHAHPAVAAEAAQERRELALAAAKVITEAPAEETKAYRVGKRLAEYATEATTRPGTPLASLIGKLEAKTPAKDGTRLVHVTLSEALALSGVAAELEGRAREEVTAGDLSAVSLVFSCTSAQAALRKLFLG
jgi:hypothetical protein